MIYSIFYVKCLNFLAPETHEMICFLHQCVGKRKCFTITVMVVETTFLEVSVMRAVPISSPSLLYLPRP